MGDVLAIRDVCFRRDMLNQLKYVVITAESALPLTVGDFSSICEWVLWVIVNIVVDNTVDDKFFCYLGSAALCAGEESTAGGKFSDKVCWSASI